MRPIPDEEIAGYVRRFEAGESMRSIAESSGRHLSTLSRRFKKLKIDTKHGVPESEVDRYVELYVEKRWNIQQIVKEMGRDKNMISRHLRKRGVDIKPNRGRHEQKRAEAVERYQAGERIQQIAKRLGISEPTVYVALREAKVELRRDEVFDDKGNRRCAKCEKWKPVEKFWTRNGKPASYCIPCDKQVAKQNREKRRAYKLRRESVLREEREKHLAEREELFYDALVLLRHHFPDADVTQRMELSLKKESSKLFKP